MVPRRANITLAIIQKKKKNTQVETCVIIKNTCGDFFGLEQ